MVRRGLLLWAVASVAGCIGAGCVATAGATTASIYRPFTAAGHSKLHTRSVHGECWTGSFTRRRDAWRCFTAGHSIYDPCFSSSRAPGVVLCPTSLRRQRGIKIRLTKTLPFKYRNHGRPSVRRQPWRLQLSDGAECSFSTGATSVIGSRRANYFCSNNQDPLWGYPYRGSSPWTIFTAPWDAEELTDRVSVRRAWM